MPGIVEFPKLVQDALTQYGDLFSNECQCRHFAEYLTGLFVAERKTVLGIHREFAQITDQSCLNRFLTEADWDVNMDINAKGIFLCCQAEVRYFLRQGQPNTMRSIVNTASMAGKKAAALLARAAPPVSASVLFYWLFNPDGGLVDWSLARLPHWLVGSTDWAGFNWTTSGALSAYTVATVLVVWQGFPFIAVSVLAGLKTVPAELLEAARVDGAGAWRGFWRITFPLLKPGHFFVAVVSVIGAVQMFDQSFLIGGASGGPNSRAVTE